MSQSTQYVTRNGEVSAGVFEWTHRLSSQTVVWVSGGAGAVLGGVIGWFMGEGEEWPVPLKALGALGVAAVGFLFFWALARSTYSVHLRLKNGQLEATFNRKTVKLPAGAIVYAGRAEFAKSDKRRMSTTRLIIEPGPGLEFVSRQGHYITATTQHADAVLQALLTQGMHPDALRIPFPAHINAKPPAWREQR
ncbi:hypothetical protein [Streptomyces sp. KE1]|uniref:hypothetical protein n=1 Tax=Streptomyces sp. KE1 TaxID=1638939 RepID=UPI00131AC372|nr:hypothetical protein [Streptomyces sp. KE1]